MTETRGQFVRQEQMQALLHAESDERTRSLARMLLASLWRCHASEGVAPVGEFDLALFMRAAIDFARKHDLIAAVLRGDDCPDGWSD